MRGALHHPARARAFWLLLLAAAPLSAAACNRERAAPTKGQEPDDAWSIDSPFSDHELLDPRAESSSFSHADFSLGAKRKEACAAKAPFLPAPGQERISVLVELEAKGQRAVPTSPLAFSLLDRQGRRYGVTLAGCKPGLPAGVVSSGKRVTGYLAFDVPENVDEWELVFEPFLVGRPRVRARVLVP